MVYRHGDTGISGLIADYCQWHSIWKREASEKMNGRQRDCGPGPCVIRVEECAMTNRDFRRAVWTGCRMQMTLMCIPPCGEVGVEMHEDTDQLIRVEQGDALVVLGRGRCCMEKQSRLFQGEAVFVPAGTWHNIVNVGDCPLKLSSVYAPPHHPAGTVHHTREDAM